MLIFIRSDIITQSPSRSSKRTHYLKWQFLSYEPGKEVPLAVLCGKKKLTLKAKIVTRPYETDDNATVIYDEAAHKYGQLSVIINKPHQGWLKYLPCSLFGGIPAVVSMNRLTIILTNALWKLMSM